ncbi:MULTISPECIES: NAD(P)H-binding protein [unclassified Streptomyces]|uniref:NAD(P)H-binding protein n=1 Tax=unclassified Streptomyces TaxID=2593676 RepID=UPI0033F9F175
MILITGATGTIGSEVTRLLAVRGVPHRALTRDPARAAFGPATEVVRGDLDDPGTLDAAVAGATAVFMVTLPGSGSGPGVQDKALLDAAVAAGVRRVVKLSAIGTGEPGAGGFGMWHVPGEEALRASGLEWTVLRPTTFASNFLWSAPEIRAGRPVPNQFGDGAQGVIDPRDIAEAAVEALLADGHNGRVHTLTGPELLTVPDQAAAVAAAAGRPVETVELPLESAREYVLAAGIAEESVDSVLEGFAYVRAGRNAIVTDDVERILGRPPRTFAMWAEEHKEAFV